MFITRKKKMLYMCTGCFRKVEYDTTELLEAYRKILEVAEKSDLRPEMFFEGNIKTCPYCGGSYEEIDELVYPSVYYLNKIGLTTNYSCSGHSIFNPYSKSDSETLATSCFYTSIMINRNIYPTLESLKVIPDLPENLEFQILPFVLSNFITNKVEGGEGCINLMNRIDERLEERNIYKEKNLYRVISGMLGIVNGFRSDMKGVTYEEITSINEYALISIIGSRDDFYKHEDEINDMDIEFQFINEHYSLVEKFDYILNLERDDFEDLQEPYRNSLEEWAKNIYQNIYKEKSAQEILEEQLEKDLLLNKNN